jgi:FixJ family two-component response regulator
MPGMTGRELAQALIQKTPDLPIIFMSGYAAAEHGPQRFSHAKFLQKPFTRAELMNAVCEGLEACPFKRTPN